uniref:C-type lectin domain-containing protein n=1 Tax=Cyclopterus lumpus TaxID=8103 RepID=A0A8C2WGU9_CYCLU
MFSVEPNFSLCSLPGNYEGKWETTNCFKSLGFICEMTDSHCDAGYLLYGDFCYQFETESVKTWHDAEAHCSREQAHLASLHSEEELSFLTGDPTGISLWMGGHDSVTEGGWEWSNGSPFRYIRWSPGNPDNFNGEDCLSILINNGYWNDDTCQVSIHVRNTILTFPFRKHS